MKLKNQFQELNPMRTSEAPGHGHTVIKRWTAGDHRIHCRPAAIDRTPGGHCRYSGRSSQGNQLGIIWKFSHFQRESACGRTVSRRQSSAPTGWLYDIIQGQENRPMSYRSWKLGIRQKSSGRRWNPVQLGHRLKWNLYQKYKWPTA